jgi:hypothetical protein
MSGLVARGGELIEISFSIRVIGSSLASHNLLGTNIKNRLSVHRLYVPWIFGGNPNSAPPLKSSMYAITLHAIKSLMG